MISHVFLLLLGRLYIWPNMLFGVFFSSKWQKWSRVTMLRAITGWPDIDMCLWIHLPSQWSFQKLFLKSHKDNSLEVQKKWSIFQVILLLGVGNGRYIQRVFGRLPFFTSSKMPLAILVTIQTCPVTRGKVQLS